MIVASFGAIGVTAGAHRLWAHRSYKAKWPMRVILMLLQTTAFQVSLPAILLHKFIRATIVIVNSRLLSHICMIYIK